MKTDVAVLGRLAVRPLFCCFLLALLFACTQCPANAWKVDSIQRNDDGSVSLSFPSEEGWWYEIFWTDLLGPDMRWHRAAKDIGADTSGTSTWTDTGGACRGSSSFAPGRFYCVAVQEDNDSDGLSDADEHFIYKTDSYNADEMFEPMAEYTDWQPQDYSDSRGVTAVYLDLENRRLELEAHLDGSRENEGLDRGEAWLDLRYVPGLEGRVPIDMCETTITAEVEVPAGFVGSPHAPNGIAVFVKDDSETWRCQYGTWVNVTSAGTYKAALSPTTGQIPGGYTKPGFDTTRIRIIGVKFAIGEGSDAQYDGPLYVTNLTIEPPIPLIPPPSLPPECPPPTFAEGDKIEVKTDGFYLNDKRWFMVGGNWRVIEYGQNFGATAWFPSGNGISKHPNFVKANLDNFQLAGIKVVRVGLLEDGRTVFDKDGHVTGYDEIFREDVGTFLDLAEAANIMVELVLLDYLIAGKAEDVEGVWVRGREAIITDDSPGGVREEFINDVLQPFLEEFGSHPALIGFDVINEPEWILSRADGGDWESVTDLRYKAENPIPGDQMRSFIGDCIRTISDHAPGKLVTVGISIKYTGLIEDLNTLAEELEDLKISYYAAVHHYPWMGDLETYVPSLPGNKPWSLEEYPTNSTPLTITNYLDLVFYAPGAGAMLWNLSPAIDECTFPHDDRDAVLTELRRWVDAHEIY